MGRNLLPMLALMGALLAMAGFAVKGGRMDAGSKAQDSKEKSLSVTATVAAIDQRQPQHLKTATFALG